jgi:hypothetical protein
MTKDHAYSPSVAFCMQPAEIRIRGHSHMLPLNVSGGLVTLSHKSNRTDLRVYINSGSESETMIEDDVMLDRTSLHHDFYENIQASLVFCLQRKPIFLAQLNTLCTKVTFHESISCVANDV